jgi:5'-nucleotidase
VRIAIENQMRSGLVLNVNVPYQPVDKILGTQVTRLGRRIYHDLAKKIEDPRGKTFFWLAGETPTGVIEPGTDISAVAEGYISITPLELDHTAYSAISEVSNWDSQQQDNFLVFPQCEMFWREM